MFRLSGGRIAVQTWARHDAAVCLGGLENLDDLLSYKKEEEAEEDVASALLLTWVVSLLLADHPGW